MSLSLAKQRLNETPLLCLLSTFCPKASLPCKWAIKKSLSRVFIHNFQLQQQKQQFVIKFKFSLSLEPFGAAAEKQLEVNPFDNLLPSLIMHRLPSVANFTQEKLGFQEGGGHMEHSHWALISYLSLECLSSIWTWNNTCDKWRDED